MCKEIASGCGGDVRKAMNAVELSVIATDEIDGKKVVRLETVEQLVQKSAVRYDREGDEHYDIISAYQKVCAEAIPMPHFITLQDCLRQATCRVRVADLWCVRVRMWDLRIRSFCRL